MHDFQIEFIIKAFKYFEEHGSFPRVRWDPIRQPGLLPETHSYETPGSVIVDDIHSNYYGVEG